MKITISKIKNKMINNELLKTIILDLITHEKKHSTIISTRRQLIHLDVEYINY